MCRTVEIFPQNQGLGDGGRVCVLLSVERSIPVYELRWLHSYTRVVLHLTIPPHAWMHVQQCGQEGEEGEETSADRQADAGTEGVAMAGADEGRQDSGELVQGHTAQAEEWAGTAAVEGWVEGTAVVWAGERRRLRGDRGA